MGKLVWIVMLFIVVGGYMIVMNNDLDLEERSDQTTFVKEIGRWFMRLGKSTKNTVGYAIEQDWLPEGNNTLNITEGN